MLNEFKERFRTKLDFLSKHGEFSLKSENQICKPQASKLHNYSNANSRKVIEGSYVFTKADNSPSHFPKIEKYVPYTLREYIRSRPNEYIKLGGLGSCNIKSKEWQAKNLLYEKRHVYGNSANYSNLLKNSDESLNWIKEKYKKSISYRHYASCRDRK